MTSDLTIWEPVSREAEGSADEEVVRRFTSDGRKAVGSTAAHMHGGVEVSTELHTWLDTWLRHSERGKAELDGMRRQAEVARAVGARVGPFLSDHAWLQSLAMAWRPADIGGDGFAAAFHEAERSQHEPARTSQQLPELAPGEHRHHDDLQLVREILRLATLGSQGSLPRDRLVLYVSGIRSLLGDQNSEIQATQETALHAAHVGYCARDVEHGEVDGARRIAPQVAEMLLDAWDELGSERGSELPPEKYESAVPLVALRFSTSLVHAEPDAADAWPAPGLGLERIRYIRRKTLEVLGPIGDGPSVHEDGASGISPIGLEVLWLYGYFAASLRETTAWIRANEPDSDEAATTS